MSELLSCFSNFHTVAHMARSCMVEATEPLYTWPLRLSSSTTLFVVSVKRNISGSDGFFSLNTFYYVIYVIFVFLFLPSGRFHLPLWEDRLIIVPTHSGGGGGGNCYARHISGSAPTRRSPSLTLPDYFFHCVTRSALSSQSLCISSLHWHAHVPLRGDWQQQMISMMHHSSICSWRTHSPRSHEWGTRTVRINISPSVFSWIVCR